MPLVTKLMRRFLVKAATGRRVNSAPFLRYNVGMELQVAQIVPCTQAEGPGKRYALWFQGCPLRCPGCCNPEFLPFKGGASRTLFELASEIEASRQRGVEGITLLGGEPLAHAAGAAALARRAQALGLSVMVFSGFTLEEVNRLPGPHASELLSATDILVDGPYLRDRPDTSRRWIGSTNQRIHFLTDRYRADDPCWKQKNTLEIRLDATGLTVNGFPAVGARDFWKGDFRHG
jgi:anaerobic ribonucleoside-triphosphate reductase activating protein